jgi:Matrixin/FG-GAP-like repeat/Fibronectin type III domain
MKYSISRLAWQSLALVMAVLFIARPGFATTAVMLSNEQIIISSRVIIVGEVESVKAQWEVNHPIINTYVKIHITEILKGRLQGGQIVLKQLGGTVGDTSMRIYGAPEYRVGQRVLLFLNTASDGTLHVAHLFQGKYDVKQDEATGRTLVERKVVDEVNIIGEREGAEITNRATLARLTKKIKRTLRAKAAEVAEYEAQFEAAPIVEIPPEYVDEPDGDITAQYTFLGNFRWFEPDSGLPVAIRVNTSNSPITGGGITEINQALAAWTNVQTTALVLQNGGSTSVFGWQRDGVSAISFNDPLNQMDDPVGCSGTLAIGGATSAGGSSRVIGGQTFRQIFEGDVVFNNNFSCFLGISANLAEVTTHEVGHAIGFDHSPDTNAIMYAQAHGGGRGATLGSDDIAAVTFLYPGLKSAPTPTAPAAPGSLLAVAGSSTTINLSWADNSGNEDGFKLERKTGVNGTYSQIATIAAGQTSYANNGLAASTTYYYRLRSYNTVGNSSYSNEANATTQSVATTNKKTPIDFDGDGRSDFGYYRNGMWAMLKSGSNFAYSAAQFFSWGGVGQPPIVADFDGDGRADIAYIASPTGGQSAAYAILKSSTNYNFSQAQFVPAGWPSLGDTPVVGDFDGDGKADPGVWRPSGGVWIIPLSSSNYTSYLFSSWGQAGDVPVVGDFDGDGRSDFGYYRNGMWAMLKSGQGFSFAAAQFFSWGGAGQQPVVADFDGDGRADIAYVGAPAPGQAAAYSILKSSTNYNFSQAQFVSAGWPSLGDTPVVGDFDGDGKADPGVWRPTGGVWIIPLSSFNYSSYLFASWGQPGDVRLPNKLN